MHPRSNELPTRLSKPSIRSTRKQLMPLKSFWQSVSRLKSPLVLFEPSRLLARPKISEVVQDTKVPLQQSRERLVITCVIHLLLAFRFTIGCMQPDCE